MDSLDDLDNALFGTKNFETKQLSSATEPKKKVMFKGTFFFYFVVVIIIIRKNSLNSK